MIMKYYTFFIKPRIFDTYKQSWYSSINNSNRLEMYSRYKHDFDMAHRGSTGNWCFLLLRISGISIVGHSRANLICESSFLIHHFGYRFYLSLMIH